MAPRAGARYYSGLELARMVRQDRNTLIEKVGAGMSAGLIQLASE